MKLKDWDRPVIINEMVNIYNFQFYLNEGQTYRYKKLLPRIQSLIGKHGFRNSIKLLGERTFVNTFWHHPDEFLDLFRPIYTNLSFNQFKNIDIINFFNTNLDAILNKLINSNIESKSKKEIIIKYQN